MRVTFWGTRGSIPTPGKDTVRFGGNTSCVEVTVGDGHSLILDAGSGIRMLGLDLFRRGGPISATVLLTHVHWDHIQGFPFFGPAYAPTTVLNIYGLPILHHKVHSLLSNQMESVYFPVGLNSLLGKIDFHDLTMQAFDLEGMKVRMLKVNHTTETLGFRIEAEGGSVVYIPDNEIGFCPKDGCTGYDELVAFCEGADLLIHDSQYTDATYHKFVGWGHSTREEAVRLAEDARVRRLAAFHHDPLTADGTIEAWEEEVRADLAARGVALEVFGAREQMTVDLTLPVADPA